MGRAFAKPGVTIAGAAFAALMAGIVGNAILFQKGHRPAPLFGAGSELQRAPAKPVLTPPRADAVDPAPPSVAPVAPSPPAPVPAEDPTPTPAVPAAAASHGPKASVIAPPRAKAAAKGHVDLIGGLIGKLADRPSTSPLPAKPARAASATRKAASNKPASGVAHSTPTLQN